MDAINKYSQLTTTVAPTLFFAVSRIAGPGGGAGETVNAMSEQAATTSAGQTTSEERSKLGKTRHDA